MMNKLTQRQEDKQERQDKILGEMAADTKDLGKKVDKQVLIGTENKHKKKVATRGASFVYLALLIIAGVAGLLFYWSVQDVQPLSINKNPIPVKPQINRPGGYAILLYDFCKNVNAPGLVERSLVSQQAALILPEYTESNKPGCQQREVAVPIPPQAEPGIYHYTYRVTFQVNPLKKVSQQWDSAEFEVTK